LNDLLDVTSAYDTVSGLEDWVEFDSVQGATAVAVTDEDAARLIKEYFPKLQASELKYQALARWPGNHSRLLGQSPVDNLVNTMESNGIVVTRGSLGFAKMDGVSRWSQVDARPYIFLCMDKANGFRTRFDSAHELVHIVLHKAVTDADYHLLEERAHRFASAVLLPAASFARDVRYPTLDTFWLSSQSGKHLLQQ